MHKEGSYITGFSTVYLKGLHSISIQLIQLRRTCSLENDKPIFIDHEQIDVVCPLRLVI